LIGSVILIPFLSTYGETLSNLTAG
jgi:hypothetical protein